MLHFTYLSIHINKYVYIFQNGHVYLFWSWQKCIAAFLRYFYICISYSVQINIFIFFARQTTMQFFTNCFLKPSWERKLVEKWMVGTDRKLDLGGRKMKQRPKWTIVHKARNIEFSTSVLPVFYQCFKCMGDLGSAVLYCCL